MVMLGRSVNQTSHGKALTFMYILSPVTDNCPSLVNGRREKSMWPDWVSNSGPLALESDAQPTALRGPAMCVCVGWGGGCLYSHVSGGKFYFEKNHSHFFRGQKLLHVQGKASIPF